MGLAMQRKRNPKGAATKIDKHVGLRVRARREAAGASQTALGDAVGVTFQQIQKYEYGTNRISASALYKIAGALGVDVAYFFAEMSEEVSRVGLTSKGSPRKTEHRNFDQAAFDSSDSIEFTRNYLRIADPKLRKHIFTVVRSVAGLNDE